MAGLGSLSRPSRFVIVGAGITGLTAAKTIRDADPRASLTLVSDERHLPYSRPGLAYYLTNDIPQSQIFPWTETDLRSLKAIFLHGKAVGLDTAGHILTLSDSRTLAYDVVLLATGAPALLPDVPGAQLEGVVTLDRLDDVTRILSLVKRTRRAVVIGGGITAVEIAEGLAARGVETHYFMRKDRFWGQVLDPDESRLVEQGMRHHGIRLHYNTNAVRVLGQRGRVKGVLTEQGESIACQMVGFAIGIGPRLDLARAAGLNVDRGILTDEYLHTSAADVLAAGDAAQVFDPASGKHILDSLWWMAAEQGRAAGVNMAGGSTAYLRGIPFNVTRVGGLIVTIVGHVGQGGKDADLVSIVHGDSDSWREGSDSFAVHSNNRTCRIRLAVGEDCLVGAVILGDQTLSRPLTELVCKRVPLGRLRQQLLKSPEQAVQVLLDYGQQQVRHHMQAVA
jgi:NADPH-dependent 2,4-dienoyl-CoA reductase/sulfur reductase-like enzyme